MSNLFVVIRKSLAKAFDPLYESPIRDTLTAPRLPIIADISPPISDSVSTVTSEELLHLNDSFDELGNFIQGIIDEALTRVVPELQGSIIDVETDTLLAIDVKEDVNIVDDLLGVNLTNNIGNKSFDLEEEIFKLSNVIENLDLVEIDSTEAGSDNVIALESDNIIKLESDNVIESDQLVEITDLKHEINLTGLDVTADYKSANTTLHEIEDAGVVAAAVVLNVTEELGDDKIESKITHELNCTKEASTETEPIESPRSNETKEFVEKNNLINRLSEEIANKDVELIKLKDELATQISDYERLKLDCDNKNKEILEIRLELEENRDLKENYTRLEREVQELKSSCNNYDNLQRSYQEKLVAYAELAAKYEEVIKRPLSPAACNKAEDEEVEILKKQFAVKEKEFECILNNYTQLIEAQSAKFDVVNKECSTAKQHLANLEIAFTDVHQKYERSKTIIEGCKANEEKLKSTLVMFETTLRKYNEELEMLKRKNVEENNLLKRELKATKEDYMSKIGKFQSKIKHLEIKATSLSNALEQKNKECQELTKLCEEMINVKSDDTAND